ncbi:MAG: DUF11 domain-containing protein [Actinomycetota bacterium]
MGGRNGVPSRRATVPLLLVLLAVPLLAVRPAFAEPDPCAVAFDQGQAVSLEMSATRQGVALALGAAIAAGDEIAFHLNWDPQDWADGEVRIADLCFRVNGQDYPGLYASETQVENDGSFAHVVTVPSLSAGDELCARGRLMGKESHQGRSLQRSNILCFTTVAEGHADVVVTKAVSRATIAAGKTVTFTVTARNEGDRAASAVKVRDDLDDRLTLASAVFDNDPGTPGGTGACSIDSGNQVTCPVGDLAPSDGDTEGAEPDAAEVAIAVTSAGCWTAANAASVTSDSEAAAALGNNVSPEVSVEFTGCIQAARTETHPTVLSERVTQPEPTPQAQRFVTGPLPVTGASNASPLAAIALALLISGELLVRAGGVRSAIPVFAFPGRYAPKHLPRRHRPKHRASRRRLSIL